MGSIHVINSLFAPIFVYNNILKFAAYILTSVDAKIRFVLTYRSIVNLHTCSIMIGNIQILFLIFDWLIYRKLPFSGGA